MGLHEFLRESLMIEGINRAPTEREIDATRAFLETSEVSIGILCALQSIYAPDMPLRAFVGMNVRVGRYIPPVGGPEMIEALKQICTTCMMPESRPWQMHVRFEHLHPYMDGNGRTGRALWAWHMLRTGQHPFAIGFLHRFYYQTLGETP